MRDIFFYVDLNTLPLKALLHLPTLTKKNFIHSSLLDRLSVPYISMCYLVLFTVPFITM